MLVYYTDTEFDNHKKLLIEDDRLDRQQVATFLFHQDIYSPSKPPTMIIAYKSGLLAYVDCNREKILGFYNSDERTKNVHKQEAVGLVVVLPKPNDDEIMVLFEDSIAMRYRLDTQTQNPLYNEKLKKFEAKTNFNKALNRFRHKTKTKNNLFYSSNLSEQRPEFSNFHSMNKDPVPQNPVAYYKFNHRTISDITIKSHKVFTKTLCGDSSDKETTIFAFTSLDGYLVIFELSKMRPLLSYKASFGGINSLTFSEDCTLVALSGQDDCITILDLNTLTTLKCEGHKSFVSKAIFQSISSAKEEKSKKSDKSPTTPTPTTSLSSSQQFGKSQYIRMIAGAMDAGLSFWEFPRDIFGKTNQIRADETQLPIRLQAEQAQGPPAIKPIHVEIVKDAIGWVETCENVLIQCGYDGVISTYLIRDLLVEKAKDPERKISDASSLTTSGKLLKKPRKITQEEAKLEGRRKTTEELMQSMESLQPRLKKQETIADFKDEQREYNAGNETVSQNMINFEETASRFSNKSPSRLFKNTNVNSEYDRSSQDN